MALTGDKPPMNVNIHDRCEFRCFLNQLIPPHNIDPVTNTPVHTLYISIIFDRGSRYTTSYYYTAHFKHYGYTVSTYAPSIYESLPNANVKVHCFALYHQLDDKKVELLSPWTQYEPIRCISEKFDTNEYDQLLKIPQLSDNLYLLACEKHVISRHNFVRATLITPYTPLLYTISKEWDKYVRAFVPELYITIERVRHAKFFTFCVHVKFDNWFS